MAEGGKLAFGFTVGPVMPAGQEGAAGDREHCEIARGLLGGAPIRYEGTHASVPRAVTLRLGLR